MPLLNALANQEAALVAQGYMPSSKYAQTKRLELIRKYCDENNLDVVDAMKVISYQEKLTHDILEASRPEKMKNWLDNVGVTLVGIGKGAVDLLVWAGKGLIDLGTNLVRFGIALIETVANVAMWLFHLVRL